MSDKFFRDRYSILSFVILIMIGIIAYRLFTLQIVKGQYYKQESEKKLFRVNSVEAPRGEIVDRFDKVLANNRAGFTVEITKTKADDAAINRSLLEVVRILEKNKDTYKDNLPLVIPFQFSFNSDSEQLAWKKKYGISLNSNPIEAFEELKKKYKIDSSYSNFDARKIMTLRYEMSENGYNSFKSVILAYDISKESISEIEERRLEFPGIEVITKPIRNYPNGQLASHVLGYIGKLSPSDLQKYDDLSDKLSLYKEYDQNDIVGKAGVESFAEVYLKGNDGKKFVETDLSSRLSRSLENQNPISGSKVKLTIDTNIQRAAEKGLEETINKIRSGGFGDKPNVKGGAAIAVDVNSGAILALASYPNYDPTVFVKGISTQEWSKLSGNPLNPLLNRSITGRYVPGSIFKMITAIAALEEGKTNPGERIQDTGTYDFYQKNGPACWLWRHSRQTHGWVNVSDAIKVSCNIYFYEMGRRLGIDRIGEYAAKFGLTQKTGIEIAGEETNIIAGKETRKKLHQQNKYAYPNGVWYPGDDLAAAIGQSDTVVTPISMANYISTLANGGKQYRLHLIQSIISSDGTRSFIANSSNPVPQSEINIKPENLKAVFEGMRSVAAAEGGTAFNTFKDFPIPVAGKTGSAQTVSGQSAHAWFAGFAPYDKPQIAVVVLIENGGSGAYTAPVAKEIFSQFFELNNKPAAEGNSAAVPKTEETSTTDSGQNNTQNNTSGGTETQGNGTVPVQNPDDVIDNKPENNSNNGNIEDTTNNSNNTESDITRQVE